MNKRIKKIKLLHSLALNKMKKAAEILSKAREKYAQEEEQLKTLYKFKDDYINKLEAPGKVAVNINSIKNQMNFIYYLDDICIQQKKAIENLEAQVKRYQDLWVDTKQKTDSLEDVLERLLKEERLILNKKEQKENDDAVLQKYSYNLVNKRE